MRFNLVIKRGETFDREMEIGEDVDDLVSIKMDIKETPRSNVVNQSLSLGSGIEKIPDSQNLNITIDTSLLIRPQYAYDIRIVRQDSSVAFPVSGYISVFPTITTA